MQKERIKYCRSNPDGTMTMIPHSQVAADSATLIADRLRAIYGHDFGNHSYIEWLLMRTPDPIVLATRFVHGLNHRITQGLATPNEVYCRALDWLESQCNH